MQLIGLICLKGPKTGPQEYILKLDSEIEQYSDRYELSIEFADADNQKIVYVSFWYNVIPNFNTKDIQG